MRARLAAHHAGGWRNRCGANRVLWNEIAQAPRQAEAGEVAAALGQIGVPSRSFAGHLLADPAVIRNKEGRGARVFTPFWRRLRALGVPAKPLPPPETLCPGPDLQGATVEDWRLEPLRPDWAGGLRDTWTPGELAGQRRLEAFLATGIEGYSGGRDRLDRDSTSRLSPYLRLARFHRARSGMPPVLRQPSTLPFRPTSTSS